MHRLLLSPVRRVLDNTFRLPPVHDPTRAISENLHATLMDRDALRRVKTTAGQSRKLTATVHSPQVFTRPDGGINQPASMAAGAHKMNARRLSTKTAGSRLS
ncbi:MAG: hypothetical protein ACJ768_09395 [Gaiellaceae bacterium]